MSANPKGWAEVAAKIPPHGYPQVDKANRARWLATPSLVASEEG
jgi:hypothetical protein